MTHNSSYPEIEQDNNTDRVLWRGPDEGNGSYYADSIHITQGAGIGIDVAGHVIVKPLRDWHALAKSSDGGGESRPAKRDQPDLRNPTGESGSRLVGKSPDCPAGVATGPSEALGLIARSDKYLNTGSGEYASEIMRDMAEFIRRRFGSVAQASVKQAVAAALARRLCQMFDSGGESQRSARARHASAIFQLLNADDPEFAAEQAKCDADPVGYLRTAESSSLPSTEGK